MTDSADAPTGRFPPTWFGSTALTATVLTAIVLMGLGVAFARPDLVVLGLPLIVSVAWAWDRRPGARRARPATDDSAAGTSLVVELPDRLGSGVQPYSIRLSTPAGTETVRIRLRLIEGRPQDLAVTAAQARKLSGAVAILHSGRQELLRIQYQLISADGLTLTRPTEPERTVRVVPPPFTAITTLPLPHRLIGLTGLHDSSRPGDGGDFRDLHPFTPGDRLRRIDWKATARLGRSPGDLYVRRTAATSDATVFLVLDSRDDVGENVADWDQNTPAGKGHSSMDLSREAASAIAAGYIAAGDRVGFQDLAFAGRSIATGTGTRHLQRLLRSIALARPQGAVSARRRVPAVSPGALVYVLSTFLDDQAGDLAIRYRAAGHRVIAVDVLPEPRTALLNRESVVAHRIVIAERARRIAAIEHSGVEFLRWSRSPASREAQWRTLARPPRRNG
jgi:uncharacterized protein (DUF58 family)